MNKLTATIRATPRFYLDLSREHVDVLMHCAKLHDCIHCRHACLQGGFLYGWHEHITHLAEGETPILIATFRELDLISKIIECPPDKSNAHLKMVEHIGMLVHHCITTANNVLRQLEINVSVNDTYKCEVICPKEQK